MNLESIRNELSAQHAHLRALIEELRLAMWANGDIASPLEKVASALHAHNHREEELLRGILLTIDAWGGARAAIMGEEHLMEHEELAALVSAPGRLGEGHAALEETLNRVLGHMAREEKIFLNEALLQDDTVVVEQFSG
jgi:hypothetical protein